MNKLPKVTSLGYRFNISKKKVMGEVDCLYLDDIKLIYSFLVSVARKIESTQNNKFAVT